MYACICAAVTDVELRTCIRAGARTLDDVTDVCGAGGGCGTCHDRIEIHLAAANAPSEIAEMPLSA
ncbi:MAG: bacterioferritin-associated ferredoxin [Pseudonocardia sp.]